MVWYILNVKTFAKKGDKNMKKKLALIAMLALSVVMLAGCQRDTKPENIPATATETPTEAPEATEAPVQENAEPTAEPTAANTPTQEPTPTEIPHEHSWIPAVIDATCTQEGKSWEECTCGERQKETVLPALGHGTLMYTVISNPTVEKEGSYEEICEVCQSVVNSGTIAKLEPTPTPSPSSTPTPKPTATPTPTPAPVRLENTDCTELADLILSYIKGEVTTLSDPRLASVTSLEIYGDNCCKVNYEGGIWKTDVVYDDDKRIQSFNLIDSYGTAACNAFAIDLPVDFPNYLPNIKKLVIYANKTGDLSAWKNLSELHIENCIISNINDLSELFKLETLRMLTDEITDIRFLSGLTNLKTLDLSYNDISDISLLAGFTKISNLTLDGNNISDITALKNLKDLDTLSLRINQLSDISVLSELTKLTLLNLDYNNISDFKPLHGLNRLNYCYVRDNNYTIDEGKALKNALSKCYVDVRYK